MSAIETLDDGRKVLRVVMEDGEKVVPVPVLPPGTSNVVVMATKAPDTPEQYIFHVYIVSPLQKQDS